jgi:hypothetical protein
MKRPIKNKGIKIHNRKDAFLEYFIERQLDLVLALTECLFVMRHALRIKAARQQPSFQIAYFIDKKA